MQGKDGICTKGEKKEHPGIEEALPVRRGGSNAITAVCLDHVRPRLLLPATGCPGQAGGARKRVEESVCVCVSGGAVCLF